MRISSRKVKAQAAARHATDYITPLAELAMGLLFYAVVAALILAGIFLVVLMHAGYFSDVRIRTSVPLSLPGRVAYKLYRGSYSNAGAAFKELAAVAPHLKTVGIYYDDPNKVPKPQLRYIIGGCLPSNGSPQSEQEERLRGAGYSMWTFPKSSSAVITEFPLRSMLSVIIAPGIIYPALSKYFKENKLSHAGPVLELCEADYIRYVAPLENKEGFFVPEVADLAAESKKDQ